MQLLTKYEIFKKLPQILHIHKNRNFFSIIVIFLDLRASSFFFPITFVAGTGKEST